MSFGPLLEDPRPHVGTLELPENAQDPDDVLSLSPTSKKKAMALGIDTRNVPAHLLQPVALRAHSRSPHACTSHWRTASGARLVASTTHPQPYPSRAPTLPDEGPAHSTHLAAHLAAPQPLPRTSHAPQAAGDASKRSLPPTHAHALRTGTHPLPSLAPARRSPRPAPGPSPKLCRASPPRASPLQAPLSMQRSHVSGSSAPEGAAAWHPPLPPLVHSLGLPWNVAQHTYSVEQTLAETQSLARQACPGAPGLPYLGVPCRSGRLGRLGAKARALQRARRHLAAQAQGQAQGSLPALSPTPGSSRAASMMGTPQQQQLQAALQPLLDQLCAAGLEPRPAAPPSQPSPASLVQKHLLGPHLTPAQLGQCAAALAQLPSAAQVQGAALLLQSGFYFAAVRAIRADAHHLLAVLLEEFGPVVLVRASGSGGSGTTAAAGSAAVSTPTSPGAVSSGRESVSGVIAEARLAGLATSKPASRGLPSGAHAGPSSGAPAAAASGEAAQAAGGAQGMQGAARPPGSGGSDSGVGSSVARGTPTPTEGLGVVTSSSSSSSSSSSRSVSPGLRGWQEVDKLLFLEHFQNLQLVAAYWDVRDELLQLGALGAASLARIEREMLLKVVKDFQEQLRMSGGRTPSPRNQMTGQPTRRGSDWSMGGTEAHANILAVLNATAKPLAKPQPKASAARSRLGPGSSDNPASGGAGTKPLAVPPARRRAVQEPPVAAPKRQSVKGRLPNHDRGPPAGQAMAEQSLALEDSCQLEQEPSAQQLVSHLRPPKQEQQQQQQLSQEGDQQCLGQGQEHQQVLEQAQLEQQQVLKQEQEKQQVIKDRLEQQHQQLEQDYKEQQQQLGQQLEHDQEEQQRLKEQLELQKQQLEQQRQLLEQQQEQLKQLEQQLEQQEQEQQQQQLLQVRIEQERRQQEQEWKQLQLQLQEQLQQQQEQRQQPLLERPQDLEQTQQLEQEQKQLQPQQPQQLQDRPQEPEQAQQLEQEQKQQQPQQLQQLQDRLQEPEQAQQLEQEQKQESVQEQLQAVADAESARLAEQVAAKQGLLRVLEAQREQLHSAQSDRQARLSRSGQPAVDEVGEEQLKEQLHQVEAELAQEHEALEALQQESQRHEEERAALHSKLSKVLNMFQTQLSQTVKLATLLQSRQQAGEAAQAADVGAAPLAPVPLPAELDEPPTAEEVQEYARYLGMDPDTDQQLLYIAEWALVAPVPEGWVVQLDEDGQEFFHNALTGQSTHEHPMDEHYRQYYRRVKDQQQQQQGQGQGQETHTGQVQAGPDVTKPSTGTGMGQVGDAAPKAFSKPATPISQAQPKGSSPLLSSRSSSSSSSSFTRPLPHSSASQPLLPTSARQAQLQQQQQQQHGALADNAATPDATRQAAQPHSLQQDAGPADVCRGPRQEEQAAAAAAAGAVAAALTEQVAAKQGLLRALEAEREQLHSAQSDRQARRSGTGQLSERQLKRQLRQVESKLRAERTALQALLGARERHAEEKQELEGQLCKAMCMYQEQLKSAVKMAAMLRNPTDSLQLVQRSQGPDPGAAEAALPPLLEGDAEAPAPAPRSQVIEYARYLGMDPVADEALLHIAEWALTAPVPEGWTVHLDEAGQEYFHNMDSQQSTHEHPMDQHYRQMYLQAKAELLAQQPQALSHSNSMRPASKLSSRQGTPPKLSSRQSTPPKPSSHQGTPPKLSSRQGTPPKPSSRQGTPRTALGRLGTPPKPPSSRLGTPPTPLSRLGTPPRPPGPPPCASAHASQPSRPSLPGFEFGSRPSSQRNSRPSSQQQQQQHQQHQLLQELRQLPQQQEQQQQQEAQGQEDRQHEHEAHSQGSGAQLSKQEEGSSSLLQNGQGVAPEPKDFIFSAPEEGSQHPEMRSSRPSLGSSQGFNLEETKSYALYLGIDPEAHPDLLHIAASAMAAPLPVGWTVHLDKAGQEYFYNVETKQSTYEHPMDQHYKQMAKELQQQQQQQQQQQ